MPHVVFTVNNGTATTYHTTSKGDRDKLSSCLLSSRWFIGEGVTEGKFAILSETTRHAILDHLNGRRWRTDGVSGMVRPRYAPEEPTPFMKAIMSEAGFSDPRAAIGDPSTKLRHIAAFDGTDQPECRDESVTCWTTTNRKEVTCVNCLEAIEDHRS